MEQLFQEVMENILFDALLKDKSINKNILLLKKTGFALKANWQVK